MRATRRLIGLGLALGLFARPAAADDLRDLYFGEALYHSYKGQYFDALQRLDAELAMYHGLDFLPAARSRRRSGMARTSGGLEKLRI